VTSGSAPWTLLLRWRWQRDRGAAAPSGASPADLEDATRTALAVITPAEVLRRRVAPAIGVGGAQRAVLVDRVFLGLNVHSIVMLSPSTASREPFVAYQYCLKREADLHTAEAASFTLDHKPSLEQSEDFICDFRCVFTCVGWRSFRRRWSGRCGGLFPLHDGRHRRHGRNCLGGRRCGRARKRHRWRAGWIGGPG
jgi:hypothetical protein